MAARIKGDALISRDLTVTRDLLVDGGTLKVDASTNRVGVNNLTPAHDLDIYGSQQVAPSSGKTGPGTVSITGTAVTGTGTEFTAWFSVGDSITATTTSGSEVKIVTSVTSDTAMVTEAFAGTATNVAYTATHLVSASALKVLPNGNIRLRNSANNFNSTQQHILDLATAETFTVAKSYRGIRLQHSINFTGAGTNSLIAATISAIVDAATTQAINAINTLNASATVTSGATSTIAALNTSTLSVTNSSATATVTSAIPLTITASQANGGVFTSIAMVRIGAIPSAPAPTNSTLLLMGTTAVPTGIWAINSASTAPSKLLGQFQLVSGALGTPSYSFFNDTDTGMYNPNPDTLAFQTAGTKWLDFSSIGNMVFYGPTMSMLGNLAINTNTLYVDSTTNRVGIGIGSPTEKLDVVGNIKASGQFLAANGSAAAPSYSFSSDPNTGIFAGGTDTLHFSTGGSERARIDASGNFLIGTTSSSSRLAVVNTITATTGTNRGILFSQTFTPSGVTSSLNNYAFESTFNITGSENFSIIRGNNFSGTHGGTGTVSDLQGFNIQYDNNSTGTITNYIGARIRVGNLNAGGNITTAYALRLATTSNAGTIGDIYGLYIDDLKQGAVTNSYGVYQTGATSINYFAGKVGIGAGITAPTNTLSVGSSGNSGQTNAHIQARGGGNAFEFGHVNPAGYASTLGAQNGNGHPFLAFNAEAGTTNNTYRTRGILGSILKSNIAGGFQFQTVSNSNADNQTATSVLELMASGQARILKQSSAGAPDYSFLSDTNTGMFSSGAGVLNFATTGSERARIDNAGLFGIGTTAPASTLHVHRATGNGVRLTCDDAATNTLTLRPFADAEVSTNEILLLTWDDSKNILTMTANDAGNTDDIQGIIRMNYRANKFARIYSYHPAASPDGAVGWKLSVHNGTTESIALTINELGNTSFNGAISANNFTDGTYTPTLTNESNISASTAYTCQYVRVGNTVTVSGKVDIDQTSAGSATLGMSLPIAANIAAQEQLAGVGASVNAGNDAIAIRGDATNDRAQFVVNNNDLTNHSHFFTFTYKI